MGTPLQSKLWYLITKYRSGLLAATIKSQQEIVTMTPDVLTQIYNAIDPFKPLEPGDPAYVDCQAERGDTNVVVDLGRDILRSNRDTCQLFAGHRGAGKSTELLRLKADLEAKGCFVVYFAAVGDDGDIDPKTWSMQTLCWPVRGIF